MALDLYLDGVRYLRPPEPVQAPPSPTATPVSSPSATPADATAPTASAAQIAAANQSATNNRGPNTFTPQGIQQFALQQGDSIWDLLANKNQNVVDKKALSDDALLKQNLAATPWLDQQAFGTRPANKPYSLENMPVGGTVTLLSADRLNDLEQQRAALASYEQTLKMPGLGSDRADMRAEAVSKVAQSIVTEVTQHASDGVLSASELDQVMAPIAARAPDDQLFQAAVANAKQQVRSQVATSAQGVIDKATVDSPVVSEADIDKALAPIAARAPGDAAFQKSLNDAKQAELQTAQYNGRTPDQVGKLINDAKSGNTNQLTQDLHDQLYAVATGTMSDGQVNLSMGEGALLGRASVYRTYLDPKYQSMVDDAYSKVKTQVTQEQPMQRVIDAANGKGSDAQRAAAAAAAFSEVMTVSTGQGDDVRITPEQAQAIARGLAQSPVSSTDPRSVLKMITDGILSGMSDKVALGSPDQKAAQAALHDLSTVAQTLSESDPPPDANGKPSPDGGGKAMVDQLAGQLAKGIQADPHISAGLADEPHEWFQSSAKEGNVALGLSTTVQLADSKTAAANPIYDAIQSGLKEYQDKTLTPLAKQIATDEQGYAAYRPLQTPEQRAAIDQKLQDTPTGKKMVDDELQLSKAQTVVGLVQSTIQDYATQLSANGASPSSPAALQAFDGLKSQASSLEKAVGMQDAFQQANTPAKYQALWQLRVAAQVGKQVSFMLGGASQKFLTGAAQKGAAAIFGNPVSGKTGLVPELLGNKLSGPVFLTQALLLANSYNDPTLNTPSKIAWTSFSVIYGAIGLKQTLDTYVPNWKSMLFTPNADGKATTPVENLLQRCLTGIANAANLSDKTKALYTSVVTGFLKHTGDVTGPLAAIIGAEGYATDNTATGPVHALAFTLATLSDFGPLAYNQYVKNFSGLLTKGPTAIATPDAAGFTAYLPGGVPDPNAVYRPAIDIPEMSGGAIDIADHPELAGFYDANPALAEEAASGVAADTVEAAAAGNAIDLFGGPVGALGLAGNVLASSIQDIVSRYDNNHAPDSARSDYLTAAGVKEKAVADAFAKALTMGGYHIDASPVFNAYFTAITQKQNANENQVKVGPKAPPVDAGTMEINWMNSLTPGKVGSIYMTAAQKADAIANYAKRNVPVHQDKDGNGVIAPTDFAKLQDFIKQLNVPLS